MQLDERAAATNLQTIHLSELQAEEREPLVTLSLSLHLPLVSPSIMALSRPTQRAQELPVDRNSSC